MPNRSGMRAPRKFGVIAALLVLGVAGCTTRHYRKSADREVYGIVRHTERQVLGRTNAFTIDTPYSPRDPQSILPQEIVDDRLQTNRRVLTIEEALDLAVISSRRYQDQKERLYLTAMTLSSARYEFGPKFSASSTAAYDRSSNGERTGSVNSRLGADQLFRTGGRLGASIANDLFRYYTGDPRRSAISTISVNLVQPLVRGFGRYNAAVESLTQAERNMIYGVRSYSFFQNQFAVEIVNDYFDLLAEKDIVRNRYTNYLSRVQSTRRLEARAVDREQAIAVGQARQAELSAKNNYVNSVAGYQNALDQFKIKLGLPLAEQVQLDDTALKVVENHGLVPVSLPRDGAYRLAVERQLEILNAIDRYEDGQRKIKVAANRLKADLNLFADASLQSEGPTDYTKFDADRISAGVGLQLNLPLDRLRERNDYRATLIDFESELRTLSLTLDTLKDSIDRGLRTLEQRRQNYEIQKNALLVADSRVLGATQGFEAGRVEVRDVIEAQDAQVAAQNAVTAALVSYQQALLQLLLDIGVLETESPQFWLRDHLAAHFRPEEPAPDKLPRDELLPPEIIFGN